MLFLLFFFLLGAQLKKKKKKDKNESFSNWQITLRLYYKHTISSNPHYCMLLMEQTKIHFNTLLVVKQVIKISILNIYIFLYVENIYIHLFENVSL